MGSVLLPLTGSAFYVCGSFVFPCSGQREASAVQEPRGSSVSTENTARGTMSGTEVQG